MDGVSGLPQKYDVLPVPDNWADLSGTQLSQVTKVKIANGTSLDYPESLGWSHKENDTYLTFEFPVFSEWVQDMICQNSHFFTETTS